MNIGPLRAGMGSEIQVFYGGQINDAVVNNIRNTVEITFSQAQKGAQEYENFRSEELQKLLEDIRKKFDMLSKYLKIDIDTELDIPVAKIVERDTNRVIRQIPPDYLLDLMKKIDQMLGILLKKEV